MADCQRNKSFKSVVCIASSDSAAKQLIGAARSYKSCGSRTIIILGGELSRIQALGKSLSRVSDEQFYAASNQDFSSRLGVVELLGDLFDCIEKSTHTQYPELIHAFVPDDIAGQILRVAEGVNVKTIIERIEE